MAVVNSIGVYKGENVQLNFGVDTASFTTQPLLAGAATIFVQSTAGFPSSGTLYLLPNVPNGAVTAVTYTGLTAGSFTGCANVPAVTKPGALVTAGATDITNWTLSFNLKRNATDAAVLLNKVPTVISGPGSILRVSLAKADTNRAAGTYQHDVWRTDAGAETCLSVGPFQILQEVLN